MTSTAGIQLPAITEGDFTMTIHNIFNIIANDNKLNCYRYGDTGNTKGSPIEDVRDSLYDDNIANSDTADINENGDVIVNGEIYVERKDEFTFKGEEAFLRGICSTMPDWYTRGNSNLSSDPWFCPWNFFTPERYIVHGMTPYEMGRAWAKRNMPELTALHEQNINF